MAVKQRMSCLVATHTHLNGPLSGTTRVSRYQKGKTDLDFTEARDSEWQWHQLGCMQVCTSLQTDKHASTPPLSIFTGRMPFLPPNQQRQSTEGQSIDGTDRETDGERRCYYTVVHIPQCKVGLYRCRSSRRRRKAC